MLDDEGGFLDVEDESFDDLGRDDTLFGVQEPKSITVSLMVKSCLR
jgi:hypothetical protein